MTDASNKIPRGAYAGVMLAATAAGAAAAWFLARASGGSVEANIAVGAVLIGSILTFAPAVLSIDASHWGVAVMASGVARGLFILVAAYTLHSMNPDAGAKAISKGALIGAVVILVVEAATAVRILARIEKNRVSGGAPAPATPASVGSQA